ncbi:MAG: hypothetical protein QXT27_01600 [Pyrobaculum sp.]
MSPYLFILTLAAIAAAQTVTFQPGKIIFDASHVQWGDVVAPHLYDIYVYTFNRFTKSQPAYIIINNFSPYGWQEFSLFTRYLGVSEQEFQHYAKVLMYGRWGAPRIHVSATSNTYSTTYNGPSITGIEGSEVTVHAYTNVNNRFVEGGVGARGSTLYAWRPGGWVATATATTNVLNYREDHPAYNRLTIGVNSESLTEYAIAYVSYVAVFDSVNVADQVFSRVLTTRPRMLIDGTFWDGTRFIDLAGNYRDIETRGLVHRIPTDTPWLWVVRGASSPDSLGRPTITFRFFPSGSIVVLDDGTRLLVDNLPGAVRLASGLVDNAILLFRAYLNRRVVAIEVPTQLPTPIGPTDGSIFPMHVANLRVGAISVPYNFTTYVIDFMIWREPFSRPVIMWWAIFQYHWPQWGQYRVSIESHDHIIFNYNGCGPRILIPLGQWARGTAVINETGMYMYINQRFVGRSYCDRPRTLGLRDTPFGEQWDPLHGVEAPITAFKYFAIYVGRVNLGSEFVELPGHLRTLVYLDFTMQSFRFVSDYNVRFTSVQNRLAPFVLNSSTILPLCTSSSATVARGVESSKIGYFMPSPNDNCYLPTNVGGLLRYPVHLPEGVYEFSAPVVLRNRDETVFASGTTITLDRPLFGYLDMPPGTTIRYSPFVRYYGAASVNYVRVENASCRPGEMLMVNVPGLGVLSATCVTGVSSSGGFSLHASWVDRDVVRVSAVNVTAGREGLVRAGVQMSVRFRCLDGGQWSQPFSGTDVVQARLSCDSGVLANVSVARGGNYLLYIPPRPEVVESPQLLPMLGLIVLVALLLTFLTEYMGPLSSPIVGGIIAALMFALGPVLGLSPAVAQAGAFLIVVISLITYYLTER